jgi:hypothetical protein
VTPQRASPKVGVAVRRVDADDLPGERLRDTHDLGGEAVVADLHLAEPPAGQADHPHARVGPVDQRDFDAGVVVDAGADVDIGDAGGIDDARDLQVVDGEVGLR